MVKKAVFLMLLMVLFMASWADSTVNKSIHIAAQQQVAEGVDSVNGAITIGAGAVIQGDVETVNGGIGIGRDCRIEGQVETVNGGIDVSSGTKIEKGVETVNGHIELAEDVQVARDVEVVNGRIGLTKVTVEGRVITVNGGIRLHNRTHVHGGILIRESKGASFLGWMTGIFGHHHHGKLTIHLSGNSVVEGGIRAEDAHREIEVIVDQGSEVQGPVSGVRLIHN